MSSALAVIDQDKRDSASESDDVVIVSVSERDSPLQPSETPKNKSVIGADRIQYTRDELISYKESPFSTRWPDYLDPTFNNSRGVWDPERWHLDRKRSETPPDDDRGGRGDAGMEPHKRRSGDPRERLRKEQDGIILSPQRRSFNSGCYVTLSQNSSRRPESPLSKSDRERDIGHREIPTRRIGSGRIPSRDMWDFRSDRDKDPDSDLFFQRGSGSGSRERSDDRFERRTFGRDFERTKDRHRNDERPRYGDRRRALSDSREEEPEWLSGGPTSQHDTIELRGFEDIPEEHVGPRGGKVKNAQNKTKSNARSTTGSRKLSDPTPPQSSNISNDSGVNTSSSSGPGGRSTPTIPPAVSPPPTVKEPSASPVKPEPPLPPPAKSPTPTPIETNCWSDKPEEPPDFNIEYFLKGDSIPGLLTNGTSSEGTGGSRFSQWFRRDSPENQEQDSRRSSLHDEMLSSIIDERNIDIPSLSDSDTYFAPISPAANTASAVGTGASRSTASTSEVNTSSSGGGNVGVKNFQLLEMLQRGGQGDAAVASSIKPQSIRDLEAAGKVTSVEELEARMRQGLNVPSNSSGGVGSGSSSKNTSTNKKSDEDLAAFNKLLAQLSDGKAIPATATNGPIPQKPQPLNFLQMLSKSQQEATSSRQSLRQADPLGGFGSLGGGGAAPQHPPPQPPTQSQMQIPQDLVMKLLQVQQQQQQQQQQQRQQQQQEMLTKLLAAGQQQQSQSASRLGFMPPAPSLSPLPPELQLMVNNAQPSRELLQRPEAHAILQGLRFGEITPQHLVQQLQNPAIQHRHREVLVSILKMQMQQAYCQPPPVISPNLATNPNTLSVQHPVVPRVPSPRELIVHTQSIMQSALIKKKLEEQRENFRKRQEMQLSLSPNVPNSGVNSGKLDSSSPAKHISSPTPLAFTPTSVLRKMTAEKELESSGNSTNRSDSKTTSSVTDLMKSQALTSQASLLRQTSVAPPMRPQPSTGVTWTVPKLHQQGRPIVKGNANFQYGPTVDYQQQQQQQRHNSMMSGYTNNIPRSKMTMPTPPPNMTTVSQQYNSMMMMQHRPPTMNPPSSTRAPSLQAHLASLQQQQQQQQQQNQQRNLPPSLQQLLLNQNYNTGRNVGKSDSRLGGSMRQHSQPMPIRHGQNTSVMSKDQAISPTSNQLARWFSPELLAQARAGQLPDMPPIPSTQNMLSLEELERLQQNSAAVHN